MQLYPVIIVCLLLTVSQASSLEGPPASRKLLTQQLLTARPDQSVKFEDLRVVVVNDIIGHFEVLAGVLHTLRQNGVAPTTLYTGPGTLPFDMGLLSWLGLSSDEVEAVKSKAISRAGKYSFSAPGLGDFHKLAAGAGDKLVLPPGLAADLVICVSPELAQHECERILKVLRPSFLVTFVHRGESITKRTTKLYPRQSLVALSPHVATACQHHTRVETSWTLPIAPYMDPSQMPCKSRSCLDGFVVQGHIRGWNTRTSMGYTRDYAHLWRRLLELRKNATGPAPARVHVTVLGKGDTRKLAVPPELAGDVLHMQGLQYPEFWGRMHRSLAILPLFGNEAYYTTRLSSTILASVITGTPLIADRRLLSAYSFLNEQTVFLQLDGEDEAAAMVRVQAMPAGEVMTRRQALLTLREQLYERNAWLLSTWLEAATAGPPVQTVSASLPGHKQPGAVLETEDGDYYAPGALVDNTDMSDCDTVTAAADQGARQLSTQQDKSPRAQHIIITRALRVGCRGARRSHSRRSVTQHQRGV